MEYKIGDRKGCIEIISEPFLDTRDEMCHNVKCDCGNEFKMQKSNFKKTLGKYCIKCRSQAQTRYTKEAKRILHIWKGMKRRCCEEKDKGYPEYGGRGVSICQEWLNSFESFLDWSLGNGHEKELSIDRIDNDGNYEPSNCRWATRKEQNRNTRKNIYYDIDGEFLIGADLVEKYNIKSSTLYTRLKKGLSMKDALTIPIDLQKQKSRLSGK